MKVIASSLRKGNIVEIEGDLYVVLSAENFHPGKGTPTTQVDMRRISDGVKVAQRYKTTEQVERAYVEDREHQYLYQDGDGFHFMNTETYDQVTLPASAPSSIQMLATLAPSSVSSPSPPSIVPMTKPVEAMLKASSALPPFKYSTSSNVTTLAPMTTFSGDAQAADDGTQ